MKKLILEVQTSIDGFIADLNGKTDWMIWNWGPEWKWDEELRKYHTDLTLSTACILISRQMAEEGFVAHWQKTAENSESPQFAFANHISNHKKIVFSNTLDKSIVIPGGWDNVDIASGDLKTKILELKKECNGDLLVYGGSTFVSSLIKEGLIDEFHLLVNPVALGKGLPIFNILPETQHMHLINSKSFNCGVVLLHYALKGNN